MLTIWERKIQRGISGPMEDNNGDSELTSKLEIAQRIGPCLRN
jgi:hypothetical protein